MGEIGYGGDGNGRDVNLSYTPAMKIRGSTLSGNDNNEHEV